MATPNPPLDIGSVQQRKHIYLITRQISDTTQNLENSNVLLPEDHLVVDKDKRIIKIGKGVPWRYTENHTHDEQYASLHHSHYFGYGEKWLTTTPKLWLQSDLSRHPELVPCSGQLLGIELSGLLWPVYGRNTNLISVHPNQYPSSYIEVHSSGTIQDPQYLLYKGSQFSTVSISSSTDTVSITVECRYDTVVPRSYGWYQQSGCYPTTVRLEGKVGTNWISLDERTLPYSPHIHIDLPTPSTVVSALRYSWSGWVFDTDTVFSWQGVYALGDTENLVRMPYLEAPPGYVYVVPVQDLGIGLKHEEVGDIGYTATLHDLLPINRLPCDGRAVPIIQYPELYALIGQRYAPNTVEHTVVTDSEVVVTYTYPSPQIVGGWKFHISAPSGWKIEAKKDDVWIEISTYIGTSDVQIDRMYYATPIQEAYTQYRCTLYYPTSGDQGVIQLWSSDEGVFHLPRIEHEELTPYIVARVRTEDINSITVLNLQNIISQLQSQIVQLTQRLIAVETYQQNHP